jgi:hypothetical protein
MAHWPVRAHRPDERDGAGGRAPMRVAGAARKLLARTPPTRPAPRGTHSQSVAPRGAPLLGRAYTAFQYNVI